MCLVIPLRVKSIKADQVTVTDGRRNFLVYKNGQKIKKGDFVLVQQKLITKKVPLQEAKKVLPLFSKEVRMKSGVRLAALYAYGCQAASKESKVGQQIRRYLDTGQDETDMETALMLLEPWHYFGAMIEHKYPLLFERPRENFYPPIVRGYWLGNSMKLFRPGMVAPKDMNPVVAQSDFRDKGTVGVLFRRNGIRPYHNWIVLAKAAMQGIDVPLVLAAANQCLVLSARVKKILPNGLIVVWQPLRLIRHRVRLDAPQEVIARQGYIRGIKIGDVVSLHYGEARECLTLAQTRRLNRYTQLAIKEINVAIRESKKDH